MRLRKKVYRRLIILFAAALMGGVTATAAVMIKPAQSLPAHGSHAAPPPPPVTVRTLHPESRSAIIRAQGEVVPLWETTVRAQVGGRIVFLSDRLQPGSRVKAGELLVALARSDYEMQVAEAESRLAEVAVDLYQEEREAQAARQNWARSGLAGEPRSPLVLRIPQLAAARARHAAAKSILAHAEALLGYTQIRAPYTGIVQERRVAPGETLFAGDEVATLYSTAAVEVRLQLDARQWAQLPKRLDEASVTLKDSETGATWKARIMRQGQQLDRDARLRSLFIRVDRPLRRSSPLLPGSFVQAEITGRRIPDLLAIPQSALTPAGRIWFVDGDNRLTGRHMRATFFEKGLAYLPTEADLPLPIRVAVYPNEGFSDGRLVAPMLEDKES